LPSVCLSLSLSHSLSSHLLLILFKDRIHKPKTHPFKACCLLVVSFVPIITL
jgi:hypothetical protein